MSERTAGTADRDELPQRRRMERRCTSSLSASGRDAAGSLTNAERERPRRPCVRLCDETHERQTHFSIFPTAIVLYSRRGTRPSFDYTRQIITWAAFSYRNELHRVPARVWPGTGREYVRPACTSSLGAGTYVGGVREMVCAKQRQCVDDRLVYVWRRRET